MKRCKICKTLNKNPLNKCCSSKCDTEYRKTQNKVKKAKKQASASHQNKIADDLWSKAIRSSGRCEYCGSTDNLNAHHIFSRANRSTRWDLENGICLCAKHHTFSTEFSAHLTPVEFTYWLEERYGRENLDSLRKKARSIEKQDILAIIDGLKGYTGTTQ